MGRTAVVALQIVIDDILPVGWGTGSKTCSKFQVMHVWAGFDNFVRKSRELFFHAARVRIHVNKHESGIFFQAYRCKVRFFAVEVGDVFAVTRMRQIAVKFERPCVVRAGNHIFRFPLAAQQLMTAMRADVVEGPQHVIAPTYQHDTLANHFSGNIIIGFRQFATVGDANPAFSEHLFLFVFESLVVGINRAGIVQASCGLAQKFCGRINSGLRLLIGIPLICE